jgi:poly(3-hydroxybutyrate) depolymerase
VIYSTYEAHSDLMLPIRAAAQLSQAVFGWVNGAPEHDLFRRMVGGWELVKRFHLTHERPDFRIRSVLSHGKETPVVEEVVAETPFGTLLRFAKPEVKEPEPRVLIVAPLSGHFATLLRSTVQTMVADHDVYITDWKNARDVPEKDGRFNFEDFTSHVIHFLDVLGPGAHVVAVCQPCVPALAAVAVMSEDGHPCTPRSMTLMGGPIDVRVNPTAVNDLANGHTIEWFADNMIATVPWRYAGVGRKVYPGFVQLTAFMSMNMERHIKAHQSLYEHVANNEFEQAETIRTFYDEYFAVLDLPGEFYLDTVQMVFQEARLAKNELTYRGRKVDPGKIKRTALMTVEGERDDVCALGQTAAAHDLCTGLRPFLKKHHMQAGVGHYGLFSGKRWDGQIYPLIRNLIISTE